VVHDCTNFDLIDSFLLIFTLMIFISFQCSDSSHVERKGCIHMDTHLTIS